MTPLAPARWFWGTDITRMPCPWRQCVTLFTKSCRGLRGRDLSSSWAAPYVTWLGWRR